MSPKSPTSLVPRTLVLLPAVLLASSCSTAASMIPDSTQDKLARLCASPLPELAALFPDQPHWQALRFVCNLPALRP